MAHCLGTRRPMQGAHAPRLPYFEVHAIDPSPSRIMVACPRSRVSRAAATACETPPSAGCLSPGADKCPPRALTDELLHSTRRLVPMTDRQVHAAGRLPVAPGRLPFFQMRRLATGQWGPAGRRARWRPHSDLASSGAPETCRSGARLEGHAWSWPDRREAVSNEPVERPSRRDAEPCNPAAAKHERTEGPLYTQETCRVQQEQAMNETAQNLGATSPVASPGSSAKEQCTSATGGHTQHTDGTTSEPSSTLRGRHRVSGCVTCPDHIIHCSDNSDVTTDQGTDIAVERGVAHHRLAVTALEDDIMIQKPHNSVTSDRATAVIEIDVVTLGAPLCVAHGEGRRTTGSGQLLGT